jgi:salicylate hydroxylase
MKRSARIAVAGAGIGELTAAIALRQAGFEVLVIERAEELREIGAGLRLRYAAFARPCKPLQQVTDHS